MVCPTLGRSLSVICKSILTNMTSSHQQHLLQMRKRLKASMSAEDLLDWQAPFVSFLSRDSTLTPFITRLQTIIDSNREFGEKIKSIRKLLDGVIENENVPVPSGTQLLSTTPNNGPVPVQVNVWSGSVSQSQTQGITQSIYPRWTEIEAEIDSDESLSPDEKNEAKGYAQTILEGVVTGATSGGAVVAAVQALIVLTDNAPNILKLIGAG